MIEISFLFGELLYTVIWLIVRIVIWLSRKRIDWKKEALLLLMYVNLAVIIRMVFFPMARVDGKVQPLIFEASKVFPFRVNLIPFIHLFEFDSTKDLLLNIIGNCCMFIPSGIVLPICYRELDRFWKVVGTGILISLSIEILQLPFAVRASDVDDLLLNTIGVAIGYGIFSLFTKNKTKRTRQKRSRKRS